MKRISILLMMVLLSAAAFGQTTPKPPKGVEVKYDKFKDTTTLWTRGLGRGSASMDIMVFVDGPSIAEDVEQFYLIFSVYGRCVGFCFNRDDLILLIDGERETLKYTTPLTDTAAFIVPRDLLTRIANAKAVEYQIGRHEGKIGDDGQKRIRAILDYTKSRD